jgi:hypothetical protein
MESKYTCSKCNTELSIDQRQNHEMLCLYTPSMQELENLIPCELCNSLISIDDYSNHLSMCQNPPPNIPFSSNPYLVNNILTMSNLINNRNLSNINQIIIPPEEPCINSDAESGINSESDFIEDDNDSPNTNVTNIVNAISDLYDILGIDANVGFSDNVSDLLNVANGNADSYEDMINLSDQIGNVSKGIDINKVSTLEEKSLTCPICREDVDKVRITNCKHDFCDSCLNKWLSKNNSCPICMISLEANIK